MSYKVEVLPQLSRCQWITSARSEKDIDAAAKALVIFDYLRDHGTNSEVIQGGVEFKGLRGEVKSIKYRRRPYRIAYAYDESTETFVILHAIKKKTPKWPKEDVETAVERWKQWLKAKKSS